MTELIEDIDPFVVKNSLLAEDDDKLWDEIAVVLSNLMFLLSKVHTVKARRLKRFLSGLSIYGSK